MTRARDLAAFVSNADGDIKFDTDTLFIDSSANHVGISDTTPENKLTVVEGDTNVAVVKARTSASDGRASYQIGNDADNWFMGIDGGNSDSFFISDVVDSSDRLVIDGSGNVGINEASPVSKIHAKNSSVGESWSAYAGTVATLEDNSGNGTILQFVSNNSHTGEIWFGDTDARNQGRMRYEHSSNRLELWSNAAERAAITSDGVLQTTQFGIGDTIGGDTAMLIRNKVTSSSPLNFDFICDTAGSWTPLGFYVHVSSIHSGAQRPRSAYFYIRGAVLDSGSLGSIGVADSGGDTSDVSVAVSDQGGTDPITVRVEVTHPNNRANVTIHALNYMGIQRCD